MDGQTSRRNVSTTLVTVTVTLVQGYRRGLATAAIRLRYKTTTRPTRGTTTIRPTTGTTITRPTLDNHRYHQTNTVDYYHQTNT